MEFSFRKPPFYLRIQLSYGICLVKIWTAASKHLIASRFHLMLDFSKKSQQCYNSYRTYYYLSLFQRDDSVIWVLILSRKQSQLLTSSMNVRPSTKKCLYQWKLKLKTGRKFSHVLSTVSEEDETVLQMNFHSTISLLAFCKDKTLFFESLHE